MLTFKVGVLAGLLGVHRNTVTNWIRNGTLPAAPAQAKRYTIAKSEFAAFCKGAKIPAPVMERVMAVTSNPDQKRRPAKPVVKTTGPPKGAVMVVGGGIAGIQAALDLADSGYYVYLIEKSVGIGGTMTQLDKTFPTDDCASCIILPKLVECGRHLNIELITLAHVKKVEGSAGRFSIQVVKKPRYVDEDKCIACGICVEKCPIKVPDDFNFNVSSRKAIYIKSDHCVPLKYAIDPDACICFSLGKCRACERFCPTGAINFNQQEEIVTLEVGAVILSPGFKPFDPARHDFYGYRQVPDVISSLEYERLLSVGGPNRGALQRPSDSTTPRKIVWLQCVGSRNRNDCGNAYCSNICCMASVKQSLGTPEHISPGHISSDHTSPDHILGGPLERTILFTDLRSHGKESERYFERAKNEGVRFVRALPHTLEPGPDGTGVRIRYIDESGAFNVEVFDLAVLAIGFEAPGDAKTLSRLFGIELDEYQFAKTSCFNPVQSSREGVLVAGVFQSPIAIPRAVVQATAAVSAVSGLLSGQRHTLTREKKYPPERAPGRSGDGDVPSVGVFICSCGVNIAGVVDVAQVANYAARLPHVNYVENNIFSCSADAQESIAAKIRENNLNRIVIAACTPRTHEPLFQETLRNAGLNGFMVEMANIRNHNSWVHQKDAEGATRKAKDQVRMAVAKVAWNYPLRRETLKVIPKALVVGGGVVGMTAALTLAGQGIETVLVEKGRFLGGNALKLDTCFKGESIALMMEELMAEVKKNRHITVYKNTMLESASGSVGNFKGLLRSGRKTTQIEFGAAVMATGAREAVPEEYLYGRSRQVMTQMEFDEKVLYHPDRVKKAASVVFIQCVGSREGQRMYCSRICCIHSVKDAIALKKIKPELQVIILYREIRTYGEWEEYYKEARDLGVIFIRHTRSRKPDVKENGKRLVVRTFDPVLQRPVKIHADYIVLASGVVARDNKPMADIFKISMNTDGFFSGAHPKLRPVDLSVPGLFLAGLCNYPKPVDESIEEAKAAGYRAVMLLLKKEIKSEAIKSFVTGRCDGCGLCVDVCPMKAISLREVVSQEDGRPPRRRVAIDLATCQGCGICEATCPREGIMIHGYTMDQLRAQVAAAIVDSVE